MSQKVTVIANTTPTHFGAWLEKHTQGIHWRNFPTERGRINLQSARASGYQITMDGSYSCPSKDDPDFETAYLLGPQIGFELTPLSADRTEITGYCNPSKPAALVAYFAELLAEIAKRWPETIGDINEYLKSTGAELGIHQFPSPATDDRDAQMSAQSGGVNSQGDISARGDVVGRDKVINITNVTTQAPLTGATHQEKQTGYLIGPQLRITRDDIGLQPSEFIELIGFQSEKEYLQMERNEIECPERLIDRIFEATGILPDWLKHSNQPKYTIIPDLDWARHTNQAIRQIVNLSHGSDEMLPVYVTIAISTPTSDRLFWRGKNLWASMTGQYSHLGICVEIAKHKYKVFDTQFCADPDNHYLRTKYFEPFYAFLRGLYEYEGLDSRGVIMPTGKDERDLYKGRVHPQSVLFRHKVSRRINWLSEVLDTRDSPSRAYISRNYGGWIEKLQSTFRSFNNNA